MKTICMKGIFVKTISQKASRCAASPLNSICPRRFEGVVPAPRLHLELACSIQRHLQLVKPPVEFLRREAKNVDERGSIRGTPETLIQIIVVVEEDSAGAAGEFRHHVASRLRLGGVKHRVTHASGGSASIKAARIQRIDDNPGAR